MHGLKISGMLGHRRRQNTVHLRDERSRYRWEVLHADESGALGDEEDHLEARYGGDVFVPPLEKLRASDVACVSERAWGYGDGDGVRRA